MSFQRSAFSTQLFGRRRHAFTIIELLVAAGITAMLAGFIAVIVRNLSIVWTRSGNRLGTDAQARVVLDQLQLDLQGAHFRDDGNVWLAVDLLNASNGGATGLTAGRACTTTPRNPPPLPGPCRRTGRVTELHRRRRGSTAPLVQ